MAKKGQVFQSYTEEFKLRAVQCYLEGSMSYQAVADKLGIRSCTQLKTWVRKYRDGEVFDTRKGSGSPMKGRPRTTFSSIEEERDYLKAQVDYLKKRYPNLLKETALVDSKTMKSSKN
ncbi:transposase [Paenibacillus sp. Cedars]|uniref:transposase n=1 Tax=Paenibacillus sp. Cedars TaxID=1980674 RepID=UPI0011645080|nr:transposase [Paenibacillus sp. Cedars]AWP27566.1 transposase [Paenibacillus sp. Cedars]AWP28154.1 transposase [Paenibacillus sp. Cedars]AWP28296.1 transposase [Paenibacillus sp. Cedars]AWP29047.1 transposase [Paenibacillus sp. Cedars]